MYLQFILRHYARKATGDGWESTYTTITYAYDIQVDVSLGSNNDVASFRINNVNNNYASTFSAQDKIEIYLSLNGAVASSDNKLMTCIVKNVTEELKSKSMTLKINCKSFDEILTNGLVFASRTSNVDVMEFIEAAIKSVDLRNADFGVSFEASSVNGDGNKRDGTAFPVLNGGNKISEYDKRLGDILEKYLQDDYTEDGRYYYYVDSDKVLHIAPQLGGSVSATRTEGVDFKTGKYGVNSDDVKNFIIVKCGFDAYNKAITTRYDDPVSRAKHGFRYHMIIDTKIASDLINSEYTANPSLFNEDSKVPNAYSYTTQWGVVCASADVYNQAIRDKAKEDAVSRAKAYASSHDKGYLMITLVEKPNLSLNIGDKVSFTAASFNISAKELRVKSISYSIKDTTYTLIEEVAI